MWRVYGRWLGVPVALLDVAKGFVPALVGVKLGGEWVGVLAGAAAMLGHARPIWLGFSKGGKMVATAGGVVLALAPLAAGICLLVWLATFVLFRYASLASLVTAVALPIFCLLLDEPWATVIFATAASLAVIVLHRQNIGRLLHGTESRFARSKSSGAARRALRVEPVGERRLTLALGARHLGAQLADRAPPLRQHVVIVDRLEVDLA